MFLPGESHGWRSLAGHSPWGHKESDTTEGLTLIRTLCSPWTPAGGFAGRPNPSSSLLWVASGRQLWGDSGPSSDCTAFRQESTPPSSDVPVRGLAELQRLRPQGPSSRCRGAGTPRPSSPGPARLLSAPFPLEAGVGGCIGSQPSRVCVALRSPQRVNEAQFHVRPESRPCLPHFFSAVQEFTYTPVFLGASLLA